MEDIVVEQNDSPSLKRELEANGGETDSQKKSKIDEVVGPQGLPPVANVVQQQNFNGGQNKVLFCRNIGFGVSGQELIDPLSPYNPVKLVHIAHKGQAFVEFATIADANRALATFEQNPLTIQNRNVYLSPGSRPEITGDFVAVTNGKLAEDSKKMGSPTRVVILNIYQSGFLVTLNSIYAIASYIGKVNRIVIFQKDGRDCAMVEFADQASANKAQSTLNRHYLWNNQTGLILTAFSKQDSLQITGNTHNRHDYTVPDMPQQGMLPQQGLVAQGQPPQQQMGQGQLVQGQRVQGQPQQQIQQQQFSEYGQPQQQQEAQYSQQRYGGPQQGQQYGQQQNNNNVGQYGQTQQQYAGQQTYNQPTYGGNQNFGARVVMVNGVPKNQITCDHIFNVLSFYGNIVKIKFMFQKENVALVEYMTPAGAANAAKFLGQGLSLFGNLVQVKSSQMQNVKLNEQSNLDKDFSGLRRFRYGKNADFQKHLQPPGPCLHLSKMKGFDQQTITQKLSQYGVVVSFEYLAGSNNDMAFATMQSVDQAGTAMANLHGLPHPTEPDIRNNLRIGFARSKTSMNQM